MRRVLITGALGFIGSHLADAYLQRGDEVIGIDDLSGNVVDEIGDIGRIRCYHADVRLINGPLRGGPIPPADLVVHAASPVGSVALLSRPSIVAEIVETTQAVLEYCANWDIPLVNISTSEVYGFSGVYRETDGCHVPHRLTHRIQYAAGKLAAEHLVRTSSIPNVTIRPFNVAGPRQSQQKGFVLPTFCEQALAGRPLTVFGGSQQRSFTGVWDVVDFVLALDEQHFDGRVFNVGNPGNRTSIIDLARGVNALLGSDAGVTFTDGKTVHGPDYEEAAGTVKVPDITAARSIGWEPTVELDEMILRTAEEIMSRTHREVVR